MAEHARRPRRRPDGNLVLGQLRPLTDTALLRGEGKTSIDVENALRAFERGSRPAPRSPTEGARQLSGKYVQFLDRVCRMQDRWRQLRRCPANTSRALWV